jgi:hypothetical protein
MDTFWIDVKALSTMRSNLFTKLSNFNKLGIRQHFNSKKNPFSKIIANGKLELYIALFKTNLNSDGRKRQNCGRNGTGRERSH